MEKLNNEDSVSYLTIQITSKTRIEVCSDEQGDTVLLIRSPGSHVLDVFGGHEKKCKRANNSSTDRATTLVNWLYTKVVAKLLVSPTCCTATTFCCSATDHATLRSLYISKDLLSGEICNQRLQISPIKKNKVSPPAGDQLQQKVVAKVVASSPATTFCCSATTPVATTRGHSQQEHSGDTRTDEKVSPEVSPGMPSKSSSNDQSNNSSDDLSESIVDTLRASIISVTPDHPLNSQRYWSIARARWLARWTSWSSWCGYPPRQALEAVRRLPESTFWSSRIHSVSDLVRIGPEKILGDLKPKKVESRSVENNNFERENELRKIIEYCDRELETERDEHVVDVLRKKRNEAMEAIDELERNSIRGSKT